MGGLLSMREREWVTGRAGMRPLHVDRRFARLELSSQNEKLGRSLDRERNRIETSHSEGT
jgi:hypothetical protein